VGQKSGPQRPLPVDAHQAVARVQMFHRRLAAQRAQQIALGAIAEILQVRTDQTGRPAVVMRG